MDFKLMLVNIFPDKRLPKPRIMGGLNFHENLLFLGYIAKL